ncbi:anti-sigma factor domain-containing protein [Paenibacillus sp. GCM10012303]|uniref:anti-sigma factor domain-containing protein n=1 Tax=Paenibacillus sp. GCM10012303 TaxID=3317340 RepID=UPI00362468A7
MHRGIVMEMTDSDVVVMTPDGQFKKIPRSGRVCQVGEEILFSTPPIRLKRPVWSITFALTAAVLFCIVLFTGLGGKLEGVKPIVAYVTLDINPSVEFGIDKDNEVQEARGLNDEGIKLLEDLLLTGKPLVTATETLMQRVEQEGYFKDEEGDVIISSTKVYEEAKVDESSLSQIVQATVTKHIEQQHPQTASNIQVASFVTPPTIREEALSKGVSAGKYAVYLSAKDNGNDVNLNRLKEDSVRKLAQEAGGLNKLIDTKEVPKKETLSKLLEAEKSGQLDQKVKEKLAEKSKSDKDDDKKSSKPNTSSSKNDNKNDNKNDKTNKNDSDRDDDDDDDDDDRDGRNNSNNRPGGNNGNNSNNGNKTPTAGLKPGTIPAGVNGNTGSSRGQDDRKKEEEKRKQEEQKKKEEEKRKQEEQKKKEEEKRKQEELKKKEEEKRKQEEQKKKEEENRKQEELKKKEEEKRKQEEQKKKEEEKRKEEERNKQGGYPGRDDGNRRGDSSRSDDNNRGD